MQMTNITGCRPGARPRRRAVPCLVVIAGLLFMSAPRAEPPLDLNSLRGRVLYLDFWASWCGPCRQAFPWMQQMQDAYAAQGLTVVAVNVDRERKDADRFLAAFHPTFDVRFDPKGEMAERFKLPGMPTSLLIDRHGSVRYTHVGFLPADRAAYEKQLRELLAEP